jgi:hypothetical protein
MRRLYTNGSDRWLTPPDLIGLLGPFDFDPCCEPMMPWRTAAVMIALPTLGRPQDEGETGFLQPADLPSGVRSDVAGDGLARLDLWQGIGWMNHPYGQGGLEWAEAFAEHDNGIALTASKSLDTRWGQHFLERCGLAYFLSGRILFRYPDGSESDGKWLPNALWAFGPEAERRLVTLAYGAKAGLNKYRGTLMKRC